MKGLRYIENLRALHMGLKCKTDPDVAKSNKKKMGFPLIFTAILVIGCAVISRTVAGPQTVFPNLPLWIIIASAGAIALIAMFPTLVSKPGIPYEYFEKRWPVYAKAKLVRVTNDSSYKGENKKARAAQLMSMELEKFGVGNLNEANYRGTNMADSKTLAEARRDDTIEEGIETALANFNLREAQNQTTTQASATDNASNMFNKKWFWVLVVIVMVLTLIAVTVSLAEKFGLGDFLPYTLPIIAVILVGWFFKWVFKGLFSKLHTKPIPKKVNKTIGWASTIWALVALLTIALFAPLIIKGGGPGNGQNLMAFASGMFGPKQHTAATIAVQTPTPTLFAEEKATENPTPTATEIPPILVQAELPKYSLDFQLNVTDKLENELGIAAGAVANTLQALNESAALLTQDRDVIKWFDFYYQDQGINQSYAKIKGFFLTGFTDGDDFIQPFEARVKILDEAGALLQDNAEQLITIGNAVWAVEDACDQMVRALVETDILITNAGLEYNKLDLEQIQKLFAQAKDANTFLVEKIEQYNALVENGEYPTIPMPTPPETGFESYVDFLEYKFTPEKQYITPTPNPIPDYKKTLAPTEPKTQPTTTPTATSQSIKLQTPMPAEGCTPFNTEGRAYLGRFSDLMYGRDVAGNYFYAYFFPQPLVYIGEYQNNSACGTGWPVVWETVSEGIRNIYPNGFWAMVDYVPVSQQGNLYIKQIERPEDPAFPWKWVISDQWGNASNVVVLQRDLPPTPTAVPNAPSCTLPPAGFDYSQEIENFWWQDLFFYGTNGEAIYEPCGSYGYLFLVYTRRDDHSYYPKWGTSFYIPEDPHNPEDVTAGTYFWVLDPGGPGSCTSQYDTSCVEAYIR